MSDGDFATTTEPLIIAASHCSSVMPCCLAVSSRSFWAYIANASLVSNMLSCKYLFMIKYKYILLSMQKIVVKVVLGFYKVGAKGVKWKRGYAYILSGRRDRVRVESTYSFFYIDRAPSMDRD